MHAQGNHAVNCVVHKNPHVKIVKRYHSAHYFAACYYMLTEMLSPIGGNKGGNKAVPSIGRNSLLCRSGEQRPEDDPLE